MYCLRALKRLQSSCLSFPVNIGSVSINTMAATLSNTNKKMKNSFVGAFQMISDPIGRDDTNSCQSLS